jgi:hypothetical protein
MKRDFIVSKIEALQDSSQYVLVAFTDPTEPKSASRGGNSYPQSPFGNSGDEVMLVTSPEELMKNLPKVISNMFGTSGGMVGNSPIFKIIMKKYGDMAIKVEIELE